MSVPPLCLLQSLLLDIDNEKIAYLTQTTLSVDDTTEIIGALKKKYPYIASSPKEDICYATTNRQGAVKELAKVADLILVVGSKNSSNSNRLVETPKYAGAKSFLIPSAQDFDEDMVNGAVNVGITSGASVPDILVEQLVQRIKKINPQAKIESLDYMKENVKFRLPRELLIAN